MVMVRDSDLGAKRNKAEKEKKIQGPEITPDMLDGYIETHLSSPHWASQKGLRVDPGQASGYRGGPYP